MKQDLQNRINNAVQQGVRLGFDLCDIDIESKSDSIYQELVKPSGFKPVEISVNEAVDAYLKDHEALSNIAYHQIISNFCNNYQPRFYGAYHVVSSQDLKTLITQLVLDFGIHINLNWLDVSSIKNFSHMFQSSNFNGDISLWNTSAATNMSEMFQTSDFTGDISQWDVHQVKNMSCMFQLNHDFDSDISKWDTSQVKNMSSMFHLTRFNQDLSQWDVSRVTDMSYMFMGSSFNRDISHWNVSKVKDMSCMFYKSQFNQNIGQWNVKEVDNMNSMFRDSKFKKNISQWNVRNVKYFGKIFDGCKIPYEYRPIFYDCDQSRVLWVDLNGNEHMLGDKF